MLFPTIFIRDIKSNRKSSNFYHFLGISSQCALALSNWSIEINSVFLTLFSNDSYELKDGFSLNLTGIDVRTCQGKIHLLQWYVTGQCLSEIHPCCLTSKILNDNFSIGTSFYLLMYLIFI